MSPPHVPGFVTAGEALQSALAETRASLTPVGRQPYAPSAEEWRDLYEMLCGFCERQLRCEITEAMIEMKAGGAWPEGGWVTDPGAQVTCLSYAPKPVKPLPRQQLRQMLRTPESRLPPVCDGCAAQRGSEASVSLHTRRDYAAAVRNRTAFICHEDPEKKRLCGGWCRAVRRKSGAASNA